MRTKGDSEAFPVGGYDNGGLTKREWFAGLASIGLLASAADSKSADDLAQIVVG